MMRQLGGMGVVLSILLGLALWRVKETTETKIVVGIAFVIFMAGLVAVASAAAACTAARVQDGRLTFSFCGMRTKSFALDGQTTFDLHKIGRLEVLRIWQRPVIPSGMPEEEALAVLIRGPDRYVPNGALDKDALVELLRANGVAEWQADKR